MIQKHDVRCRHRSIAKVAVWCTDVVQREDGTALRKASVYRSEILSSPLMGGIAALQCKALKPSYPARKNCRSARLIRLLVSRSFFGNAIDQDTQRDFLAIYCPIVRARRTTLEHV
jgi:hypothetical protein